MMIDRFFFYKRKNNEYYSEKWKHAEITLNINQQQLQGWFVKAADYVHAPIIIYYGGNGEDISIQLSYLDAPQAVSWLLMNYRGFGKSSGNPSEKNLFSDALKIFDYMIKTYQVDPDQICLVGRSIGSSIAAYVAGQRKVKKLVLITPFDSIANILPNFLFIRKCIKRYFTTAEYLKQVEGKILVIAAGADEVIPKRCLINLIEKFRDQIVLIEIPEANHQNIDEFPEYIDSIKTYIHAD